MSGGFYTPEGVIGLYDQMVPAYQRAFSVPKKEGGWGEVSQCPGDDPVSRCIGGLSEVAVGSLCDTCGLRPTKEAYPRDDLVGRFEALANSRPAAWYVETVGEDVALAVLGWRASPSTIATEKYADETEMETFMPEVLGDEDVLWVDEVFADKTVRDKGNLDNFGTFVAGLAEQVGCTTVAYRTIEPKMLSAAVRAFGPENVQVFMGTRQDRAPVEGPVEVTFSDVVPDWRDFVVINLGEEGKQ